MSRRTLPILLSALLLLISAGAAFAQKRVALVIGNSNYSAVAPLANPKNDATAIAGLLKQIGFDSVELALDQNGEKMRAQLSAFAQKSIGADVALVYYAGHGIEVGGVNYLLPVDANNLTTTTIGLQAIALDTVMNAIADARQLKLVILDACRDNPFAAMLRRTAGTRSVGQGLARLEPASPETLVAYAAREGTVAQDGDGVNSPYTEALLRHLGEPDLDIRLAFGRVRDDVMAKTNKRQEPFVYGSLGGQVTALVRSGGTPVAAQTPSAPVVAPTPPSSRSPDTPQVAALPPGGRLVIDEPDRARIRAFAAKHEIPVPPLEIKTASTRSVPAPASSWLGVWGSEGRWGGGGRMILLAITETDAAGGLKGHYMFGPPGPSSWLKSPAGRTGLTLKPDGNLIRFHSGNPITFELMSDGTIYGTTTNASGNKSTAKIILRPLWRPGDQQSANPKP
jgi:caspase domain-containing protein